MECYISASSRNPHYTTSIPVKKDILDGPANSSCLSSDPREVDARPFDRVRRDRPSIFTGELVVLVVESRKCWLG
jgi:hypothetical protein